MRTRTRDNPDGSSHEWNMVTPLVLPRKRAKHRKLCSDGVATERTEGLESSAGMRNTLHRSGRRVGGRGLPAGPAGGARRRRSETDDRIGFASGAVGLGFTGLSEGQRDSSAGEHPGPRTERGQRGTSSKSQEAAAAGPAREQTGAVKWVMGHGDSALTPHGPKQRATKLQRNKAVCGRTLCPVVLF